MILPKFVRTLKHGDLVIPRPDKKLIMFLNNLSGYKRTGPLRWTKISESEAYDDKSQTSLNNLVMHHAPSRDLPVTD